jgi:hypothetical protein
LQTGDADDKSGKIAPQPLEMLKRIKQTDGHAKRNVIAKQKKVLAKIGYDAKECQNANKKHAGHRTKAQILDQQASSIATLSNDFEKIRESQEQLLKTRADLARVNKLKKALNLGLIAQEEFNEKVKAIILSDFLNVSFINNNRNLP